VMQFTNLVSLCLGLCTLIMPVPSLWPTEASYCVHQLTQCAVWVADSSTYFLWQHRQKYIIHKICALVFQSLPSTVGNCVTFNQMIYEIYVWLIEHLISQ
jgi:hypothetical protein